MNAILVTGYRGFELSIFQDKDPRIDVIKAAIRKDLIHYLEEGVEWFIFTGNLGFEYWALQVAKKLQADYPFQIATLFTFETQGQQWNEANQAKLADSSRLILSNTPTKAMRTHHNFDNIITFWFKTRKVPTFFMILKMKPN